MNREYDIDFDAAKASADLAERIAASARNTVTVDELQTLVEEAEIIASQSKPGGPLEKWASWMAAARCYIAANALRDSVKTGVGVADAKARLDVLSADFLQAANTPATDGESSNEGSTLDESISTHLSKPLPILYWCRDRRWEQFAQYAESSTENSELADPLPTVARLIVYIEGTPLVSPQEVRPGTLYHVRLEAYFASWPERIEELRFHFTTTLASSQYSVSEFDAVKLDKCVDENHVVRANGTLAFPFVQNDPFAPVVFAVSAVLSTDEGDSPIRIVGHDQLAFRIRDESRTLLSSGWPRMDAHVHDLIKGLCDKQPAVRDELDVLLPLLDALTAVLGAFAQGGVLKGRTSVSEDEFQAEVLKLLRMKLGEDVQEAPKQAGGITDIRFRGCVVELKVEDSISDRDKVFAKYTSQSTQYQGVEARSIAILLVLDLTQKSKPPGDLRNDIMLKEVETHGGEGEYPSWAFMFVVRGNVKSPSSYSS